MEKSYRIQHEAKDMLSGSGMQMAISAIRERQYDTFILAYYKRREEKKGLHRSTTPIC